MALLRKGDVINAINDEVLTVTRDKPWSAATKELTRLALYELKQNVEELPEVAERGWISAEDEPPDVGEKVLCPYCGAELKLEHYGDGYVFGAAFYMCPGCGSTSPTAGTNAEALAAAQARYTQPEKWIGARDRQPVDQEEVLVLTRSKKGVRNIDKGYWSIDHFIHRGCAEVTHWMPLPELPKEADHENT